MPRKFKRKVDRYEAKDDSVRDRGPRVETALKSRRPASQMVHEQRASSFSLNLTSVI